MDTMPVEPHTIPAQTTVGTVHLRVADAARAVSFYRDVLKFDAVDQSDGTVALHADPAASPLFVLHEQPGIEPVAQRSAGLYHAAILLPERRALARMVRQLARSSVQFGHADHGVSEALYLNDPDGNGLEIYVDRPRDQWPVSSNGVEMVVESLNFENLLDGLDESPASDWVTMPPATVMGHVHLRVGDLIQARRFYVDLLGFDVMQESLPGALFLSAGGYHHHLGLNIWQSRGREVSGPEAAGLISYTIELPTAEDRDQIRARLEEHGVEVDQQGDQMLTHDHDNIAILLSVAG